MRWIETYTGQRFYVTRPDLHKYSLNDIAHALSNVCRYAGHCSSFFSVAEHSLMVADMLPGELRLFGLLHDGAEAYYGDMTSPLKAEMPTYRDYEKECQKRIYLQFVGSVPNDTQSWVIKSADLCAMKIEAQRLLPHRGEDLTILDDVQVDDTCPVPICHCPTVARQLWRDAIKKELAQ